LILLIERRVYPRRDSFGVQQGVDLRRDGCRSSPLLRGLPTGPGDVICPQSGVAWTNCFETHMLHEDTFSDHPMVMDSESSISQSPMIGSALVQVDLDIS
jgi:hypothetical protein